VHTLAVESSVWRGHNLILNARPLSGSMGSTVLPTDPDKDLAGGMLNPVC